MSILAHKKEKWNEHAIPVAVLTDPGRERFGGKSHLSRRKAWHPLRARLREINDKIRQTGNDRAFNDGEI